MLAASRTAARSLCNLSLRTASGPGGSGRKQILTCAAGSPGRGGTRTVRQIVNNRQSTIDNLSSTIDNLNRQSQSTIDNHQIGNPQSTIGNSSSVQLPGSGAQVAAAALRGRDRA